MSGSDTRNQERERLDALLSAERDGGLDASEQAELDARLAGDPAAVARRAEFAAVDEALQGLAEVPLEDAALESGLAALRARTADAEPDVVRLDEWRSPWRHPAVSLAIAAAAAFFLYLAIGSPGPSNEPAAPSHIAIAPEDDLLAPELDLDDEEIAIALGYGEGASLVPGVDDADLPVIDALEVLDYMKEMSVVSDREAEGRG